MLYPCEEHKTGFCGIGLSPSVDIKGHKNTVFQDFRWLYTHENILFHINFFLKIYRNEQAMLLNQVCEQVQDYILGGKSSKANSKISSWWQFHRTWKFIKMVTVKEVAIIVTKEQHGHIIKMSVTADKALLSP